MFYTNTHIHSYHIDHSIRSITYSPKTIFARRNCSYIYSYNNIIIYYNSSMHATIKCNQSQHLFAVCVYLIIINIAYHQPTNQPTNLQAQAATTNNAAFINYTVDTQMHIMFDFEIIISIQLCIYCNIPRCTTTMI